MRILVIPNTSSWESYKKIINYLKKKKIYYKILVSGKFIIPSNYKNNLIKIKEPKYDKIYQRIIIIKLFILLFYNLKFYLLSRLILSKYNFDNIILATDRGAPLNLSLVKIAKKSNIKIWNFTTALFANSNMIIKSRKNMPNYVIKRNSITHKLFKNYCHKHNKEMIIYFDKLHIYLNKIFNILPPDPWLPGGGLSDYFLVVSRDVKQYYQKLGCKKKIFIVGDIYKNILVKNNKHKINKKKIKIGILLTHWYEHGLLDKHNHLLRNKTICNTLRFLNKKKNNITLFLHPKQTAKNYQWVKKYDINISKSRIIKELNNLDLLIISWGSSIMSLAKQYKVNTIICNFFEKKEHLIQNSYLHYAFNVKSFTQKFNKYQKKILKNKVDFKMKNIKNTDFAKKIINLMEYSN